jgi:signal transduction histidine kinase
MRSRISWLVLATTSAIVMAFVIPLCLLVRTLAADRAMSAADQAARNVALVVTSVPDNAQLNGYVADLNRSIVPQVSVLTPSGKSLGTTDDLSQDPDVRKALTGEGLRVTRDDSGAVLLPVAGEHGTTVVRASVTGDDLQRGVLPAWLGIITLGLVLIAVGWVISRQLGRRISEPLRGVAQTAHQLREGDLSARAEVGGTPETVELAQALNGLAERTGELLAAERAAVGDLSHRLRTPVTALRLDAESVSDPAVAQRLQDHITVLQLTVDQIVKEARRPVQSTLAARCEAAATIAGRVAFWSVLAEDDGRALRVDIARAPLLVPVSASDLADLLDVLIDNVFAHTPDGTGFAVSLHAGGGTCVLSVSDDGAGWSAEQNPGPGHTGLGLDIARRTAQDCGGHLVTGTNAAGGAKVEVALPLVS